MDGCTLVNFAFSSLQLQRQRQPSSSQATNAGEEESESSPNSEIIVPDYTVDSGATNQIGSTVVVVDLLRRFPSDLIETSVDPEPLLAGMGNDTEMAAAASAARVNRKTFLSLEIGLSKPGRRYNGNRTMMWNNIWILWQHCVRREFIPLFYIN